MINVAFFLFWVFKDFKKSFLSLLIVLVGWSHIQGFMGLHSSDKVEADKSNISVISYNFNYGSRVVNRDNKKKAITKKDAADFLRRFADEDILCFQEMNTNAVKIISQHFGGHYKHKVAKHTMILSRYPIIDKGLIEFGTITNSCIWADIATPSDTFRVYNMHLKSNRISKTADEIASEGTIDDKKTWRGIGNIFQQYRKTHIKRANQAQLVRRHMDQSPYPVMACGDFNDPPLSYTYRHIKGDLEDTFLCKGEGLGTTFAGSIPLQRIDYIFVNSQFETLSHKVIKEEFSDHYPIATLIKPKSK